MNMAFVGRVSLVVAFATCIRISSTLARGASA